MSWQRYLNDDRLEQEQLDICRALIEDSTPDTVLWLQANPSTEERAHVLAIQGLLADLARIVERRMERRREVKDDWVWSETVGEVLRLLDKAKEMRGHIVGKGLGRLTEHLPQELRGPQPRLISQPTHPLKSVESRADQWKDFRNEFEHLATEEVEIVRAKKRDLYLRAYSTYEEHPEVFEIRKDAAWAFVLFGSTWDQHAEKPKATDKGGENVRGPYCLLKTPEYGVWMLSDGVSENFLERFRTLAARAGVALRAPEGSDPEDAWLHGLFHYLLANRSKLLSCAEKGKGGMILRVCEASATFCSRLEREAVTREVRLRQNVNQIESASDQNTASSTLTAAWKPERGDPEVAKRAVLVRSNPNSSAEEMCHILDREKVPLSAKWLDAGLQTWSKAYKNPGYRGRIHTLISKARRKN